VIQLNQSINNPTCIDKYNACQEMLLEVLEQRVHPNIICFDGAATSCPRQAALYAAACGLAKAAIGFAVASEGYDYDDAVVRQQAEDPSWVAVQNRQTLAAIFKVPSEDEEANFDYGA